jgi:hypothetical protein
VAANRLSFDHQRAVARALEQAARTAKCPFLILVEDECAIEVSLGDVFICCCFSNVYQKQVGTSVPVWSQAQCSLKFVSY